MNSHNMRAEPSRVQTVSPAQTGNIAQISIPERFQALAELCVASEIEIGGRIVDGIDDANTLHAGLGVGRDFSSWIKVRIEQCGLVESLHYTVRSAKDYCSPDLVSKDVARKERRGGHNAKVYSLTLEAAKFIAMCEGGEKGQLVREYFVWIEGVALRRISPSARQTKAAPRLRAQSPDAQFRDRLRSLKAAGFSVTEAAHAANRFIMEREGVDILGSAGVVVPGAPTIPPNDVPALAAPDHPNHLTVTDIGIEIGVRTGSPMSGRAVNQALVKHGFQIKGATTTTPWMPTEKGKPYAKFDDVPKNGEGGGKVNALTWKWEVISELLSAMNSSGGEG